MVNVSLNNQIIIPAMRNTNTLNHFLDSTFEFGVFLNFHISELKHAFEITHLHQKKMFIHVDLIQGLQNDEYATEFLCQEFRPYGIISTRSSVISRAKAKGLIAIQRIFLLDSYALEKSYSLLHKTNPDYIEILPGTMPDTIREVADHLSIPILAGGFVKTIADVERALAGGATAVTTSKVELWKHVEREYVIQK